MEHFNNMEPHLPGSKRPRTVAEPNNSIPYFSEQAHFQGTGFGLNFVTYHEYQQLKTEHDKLKEDMSNLRQNILAEVQKTVCEEISAVKKENVKLTKEISCLRNLLQKKGGGSESAGTGDLNGHDQSLESPELQTRLQRLEEEVQALKFSQPPVPTSESMSFMKNLVSYYDTLSSSSSNSSSKPVNTMLTTANIANAPPVLPAPIMFPDNLSDSPFKSSEDGNSNLPGTPGRAKSPVPMEVFSPSVLTPSQPTPEDSSCYTQKTQLLTGYNIWVNKSKLFAHLKEAENPKAVPPEQAPAFILRRVMLLVFSLEELAYSRGQGIMQKSTDPTSEFRQPLDPVKVQACKEYMRKWCLDHGRIEPTEKVINTIITHQITYARTKLKRQSNKLKSTISSGSLPLLSTMDSGLFIKGEGSEAVDSEMLTKGEGSEEDSNAGYETTYGEIRVKEESVD